MQILPASTGATQFLNLEAEKPIQGIVIVKDGDFTAEEIEVKVQRQNGGNLEIISESLSVKDLAEISQFGEGSQYQAGTNATDARACFINLTESGNIPMETGDRVVIQLRSTNASRTYTVYGLETTSTASTVLKYQKKSVSASQSGANSWPHNVTAENVAIAINATNLVSLDLSSKTGENAELLKDELVYLQFRGNDTVRATPTAVIRNGYESLFYLSTIGLTTVKIKTNGMALDYYAVSKINATR